MEQSDCRSVITREEARLLNSKNKTRRHDAAVDVALKYNFDPQKSIYFRSNIRSCGGGPMADIE